MTDPPPNPRSPLIEGVTQFDVDFVIPRLGIDLPVGIDPFLLYKSRDPQLAGYHDFVLQAFSQGVLAIQTDQIDEAHRIFVFPEVDEIGLGYTQAGKRGSGVGPYLTELIIETLRESPALVDRGIRHVEELQLVSIGIGPDRISDITANILKSQLISYTQRQCELWDIELRPNVPVEHVLHPDRLEWIDGYFDLPVSPYDDTPIILVPRRIVRALPWINYDDYVRMEFAAYLRATRTKRKFGPPKATGRVARPLKDEVVAVTRREIERVDHYIAHKEANAQVAQPSDEYLGDADACREAEALKARLTAVASGRSDATTYQRLCLEILNFLFSPELIDGRIEVRTVDGTERRDIIFTNDSDETFWSYIRTEHSAFLLMFEVKNKQTIDNKDLNQTATYLGDRLGRLAFVLSRGAPAEAQQRKAFSIYNDSNPRKIIVFLSDADLALMLDMRCEGKNPMRHVQQLYREFRTSVQ